VPFWRIFGKEAIWFRYARSVRRLLLVLLSNRFRMFRIFRVRETESKKSIRISGARALWNYHGMLLHVQVIIFSHPRSYFYYICIYIYIVYIYIYVYIRLISTEPPTIIARLSARRTARWPSRFRRDRIQRCGLRTRVVFLKVDSPPSRGFREESRGIDYTRAINARGSTRAADISIILRCSYPS